MITAYDSTNPFDIPANAAMVFGYIDGANCTWPQAGWDRFPNAIKMTITVMSGDADIADCETGDMTPAMCPPWVLAQRYRGKDPWVYMNESTWPAVRQAFRDAGVAEPHYWTAGYYDGSPRLDAGAIATQYANEVTSGGHYDLSLVDLTVTQKENEEMIMLQDDPAQGGSGDVELLLASSHVHIDNPNTVVQLQKAGVQLAQVDHGEFDLIVQALEHKTLDDIVNSVSALQPAIQAGIEANNANAKALLAALNSVISNVADVKTAQSNTQNDVNAIKSNWLIKLLTGK